jgi:uncharacterized protein YkwD
MLAALVVASFLVRPERQVAEVAGPTADLPAAARAEPLARGSIGALRDELALSAIAKSSEAPFTASARLDLTEVVPDPVPEPEVVATPDPTPEPTPEPTPAPTPRPAPRPTLRPFAVLTNPTTAWAELHMLELMNASRARAGLVPLLSDAVAANAARAHSAAEAQVRYVYHDGPDGTAKSRNVPACGTGWYGENTGKIWNDNVDALHIEFMAEPWEPINHRTNIMDPTFRRVGVGAVIGPDAMYMTMVFCR